VTFRKRGAKVGTRNFLTTRLGLSITARMELEFAEAKVRDGAEADITKGRMSTIDYIPCASGAPGATRGLMSKRGKGALPLISIH
jgi:hypothetical protein